MFLFCLVIRRLTHDTRGAAALEFAITGPLFIALILAMIETGVVTMKIALLDNAVAEAARIVYTGGLNGSTTGQSDLEDFICKKAVLFSRCKENIVIELTPIGQFNNQPNTAPTCFDSTGSVDVKPVTAFNAGARSEVMFMRVCMTTAVITPGLGAGVGLRKSNLNPNRRQIITQSAFLNEPF